MDNRLLFSARTERLINTTIDRLQLDLSGMNVLTEAATGPFAVTASIAGRAGARVQAVARDSIHGTARDAIDQTRRVAQICDVSEKIEYVPVTEANFSRADLVTNLGPLRPLDKSRIGEMSRGSTIALMYDAREFRADDVDLNACKQHGITVVGVNEEAPEVDVLKYSGLVAVRLLLNIGIEVVSNTIVVAGKSLFSGAIYDTICRLGGDVSLIERWDDLTPTRFDRIDAVVYADYNRTLGPAPPHHRLTAWPGSVLTQFVGGCRTDAFKQADWTVYPSHSIPPRKMWRTFAYVGAQPVVKLHAAGLKTAELELTQEILRTNHPFTFLHQDLTTSCPNQCP